jgi:hypothetical protein
MEVGPKPLISHAVATVTVSGAAASPLESSALFVIDASLMPGVRA